MSRASLLEVKNLQTHFRTKKQTIRAVDGIDLHINYGETVALVGESGSGKSMTSLSIMQLVPSPKGKIVDGEIILEGVNLLSLKEKEIRKIRGKDIAMIFQEPMTSLNPVLTIGKQIIEMICYHTKASKKQARERALQLLETVGFSRVEEMLTQYPHHLSGGMRQRVMIAMAISCNPKLLIADEPTTALDVTIQAQILALLKKLSEELGMSILLITHDFGVVSEVADKVVVMYCGQVVENTSVDRLFRNPLHPYTQGLIRSSPSLEGPITRLESIEGNVPLPDELPVGCRFAPRCSHVQEKCLTSMPQLADVSSEHLVRCFLYEETKTASPSLVEVQ